MFIYAHRGASGYAPENTISAFQKAIEMGATGIELDVQLSKDGVVMVLHDDTLERTTDGKGRLEEYTETELKSFDAGQKFSEKFLGEKIPTLEEVIKILPKNKSFILNIEFKPDKNNYLKIAEKVFQLLKKNNYFENTVISSFYHKSLVAYRKLDKTTPIGMLFEYDILNIFEYISQSGIKPVSINIAKEFVDEKIVKEAHEHNLKVAVYTVNTLEKIKELKKYGVDEIFCNYPDILK